MASLSKLPSSGKALPDSSNARSLPVMNMSLDDIILRKIENGSTEEIKNKKQNHGKNNLNSKWDHRRREYSRYRNNLEERNCDKKPHHEPSGFKSGQSRLNSQPLIKEEKCNDNDEAQAEKNQGQSEGHQHQSEGNQDDREGSQGQPEENQHHSEGSQGHLQRSHYESKRSYGQSKRSHDQLERSHGRSERSHVQSERSYGQSKRSCGQLKRSYHYSKIAYGHSKRPHGQSGRSHGQAERYRKYRPVGRIQRLPITDSEYYRAFMKNKRSENYKKQVEQRSNQMNMNRKLTPENEQDDDQNDRSSERSVKGEIKDLLPSKHATTESSLWKPKGVELEFNYQELGNQTKLSLNERFSKLREKRTTFNI